MKAARASDREWEPPERAWRVGMVWHDLLFMHWPVPAGAFGGRVPPDLEIDTYDGQAWLGVVPFGMRAVRVRPLPVVPWLSAFPEMNVRTYVKLGDRPGVWFFSLDAANRLAVRAARAIYHLPYYHARMSIGSLPGARIRYLSERVHRSAPEAGYRATYGAVGPVYRTKPGELDHWLTARHCLYAADRAGRLWRGEIDHPPWPLQPAEAEVERNDVAEPLGIRLTGRPPLLHFARELAVVAWSLDPV